MAKQYRGCSKLYYALITENDGVATYGTPKHLAPVKSVSRDIDSASEDVWADNEIQETHYAGSKIIRSFDCTRIPPEIEAELLGNTVVAIGTGGSAPKAFGTSPNGSSRPYIAVGYALHDGDADNPCEYVWAFKGKVNSITKAANTIDDGTGSDGQTIEIAFIAPKAAFTKTGKRDLDISMAPDDTLDFTKWFDQVVTFDNAATALAKS
jgi:phi13 family phage major tail protein